MKTNNNNFIKIIVIVIFIIINYYIGVLLSKGIDRFFSPCDFNNHDKLITTHIILEYIIALIIYLLIYYGIYNRYHNVIFKTISLGSSNNNIYKSIFTIAFSYGLFNNLNAMSENSRYIYHKHISKFISGKKAEGENEFE